MDELTKRLTDIEIRFTHQGQMIDELNEELTLANERIAALQREVRVLREMLSGMAPALQESPDE